MDFDPGELYEEGYEDGQEDNEPQEEMVEYDEMGNPIYLAAAAGFGYHMASDDLDERVLAEELLNNRDKKDKRQGYMTPFGRWATMVNQDPSRRNEPIEYTLEEQLKIIEDEGKGGPYE